MANTTLQAQKKALRASILARRKLLSRETIQIQSERICRALVSMPEFEASNSISCFLSMNDEVDTSSIVNEILLQGKKLFVPRMAKPKAGKLQMLRVYSFDDLHTLPSKLWGIREPDVLQSDGKTPREDAEDAGSGLEMIVMPGVAFDRSFSRLGYGKGFYDRFLSTYSGITSNVSTPSLDTTAEAYTSATGAQPVFTDPSAIAAATRRPIPKLVAVALDVQVLDEGFVPADETDWKVDAIVSPTFQVSNDMDDIVLRRDVASTVG